MTKRGCVMGAVICLTVSTALAVGDALKPDLRLEIDLVDGSRIIGVPSLESVSVQTSYAKMDIQLKQILTIEIEDDHEKAAIDLRNGDKLKGVISLEPIKLETVFGKVKIGVGNIRKINVMLSGAALSGALGHGLVLYYPFDNDNGDRIIDQSGKSNDGVVKGATWTPKGKAGGSYSFDGGGSTLIDAGNPGDLGRNFSIVVWAYPEVYDGYRCIMGKDTDDNGFSLEKANDSSSMKFWFFDGAWRNTAFRHVPPLKTWSCLAVVHDGKTVRGYFNGEQDTDAIPAGYIVQSNSRVLIGRHPAVEAARNWNGKIDEVMILDRALSDSEVKQLYDAQK